MDPVLFAQSGPETLDMERLYDDAAARPTVRLAESLRRVRVWLQTARRSAKLPIAALRAQEG